jgi:hypothetical protein
MTYGDAVFPLPERTVEGLSLTWSVDNNKVASISGNTLTIVGAGSATVTVKQAGNDSYKPFSRLFALTVNKAPLTITAKSYTITQGNQLPAFEAEYSGFVNGETSNVLTTLPTFSCSATSTSSSGTYDIVVSGAEAQNYSMNYVNGTLTIEAPSVTVGDLNDDGVVDGVDLVAQTNLIMTNQYVAAADLNNDGVVDGADYVVMVNRILNFTASAPALSAGNSNRAASTASLSIEDFGIMPGETKEMLIDLNNPDTEVTLVQFDLQLPTGLSIALENGELAIDIAGRTSWRKHQLSTSDVNGATRFLLASSTNALISGTSGAVISIMLTAANNFNGGDIKLEGQVIVTPTEEATRPADYTYTLAGKVKCATPTISFAKGKLHFACETEGVTFHYSITAPSLEDTVGNDVELSTTYTVRVYASKDGYEDSDAAETDVDMRGMKGDVNGDDKVDIADVTAVINIINN